MKYKISHQWGLCFSPALPNRNVISRFIWLLISGNNISLFGCRESNAEMCECGCGCYNEMSRSGKSERRALNCRTGNRMLPILCVCISNFFSDGTSANVKVLTLAFGLAVSALFSQLQVTRQRRYFYEHINLFFCCWNRHWLQRQRQSSAVHRPSTHIKNDICFSLAERVLFLLLSNISFLMGPNCTRSVISFRIQ